MKNNEITINIDMTSACYELKLIDAIKKYQYEEVSPTNLGRIREDVLNIVKEAKIHNIDISEHFPIKIDAGAGIHIRIFQSGDVYMHSPNHIHHAFDGN